MEIKSLCVASLLHRRSIDTLRATALSDHDKDHKIITDASPSPHCRHCCLRGRLGQCPCRIDLATLGIAPNTLQTTHAPSPSSFSSHRGVGVGRPLDIKMPGTKRGCSVRFSADVGDDTPSSVLCSVSIYCSPPHQLVQTCESLSA